MLKAPIDRHGGRFRSTAMKRRGAARRVKPFEGPCFLNAAVWVVPRKGFRPMGDGGFYYFFGARAENSSEKRPKGCFEKKKWM